METKYDEAVLNLSISYLVRGVQWTPVYDIRVYAKDKSMIINYSGLITQRSGEDWNNTTISLSTACPTFGGNVPSLGTQCVRIKKIEPPKPKFDSR